MHRVDVLAGGVDERGRRRVGSLRQRVDAQLLEVVVCHVGLAINEQPTQGDPNAIGAGAEDVVAVRHRTVVARRQN